MEISFTMRQASASQRNPFSATQRAVRRSSLGLRTGFLMCTFSRNLSACAGASSSFTPRLGPPACRNEAVLSLVPGEVLNMSDSIRARSYDVRLPAKTGHSRISSQTPGV